MPEDPRLRAVRIKAGVVKRVAKEKLMYQKEAAGLEEKLEAFKNSDQGADEALVASRTKVVNESRMMIPDTQRRLNVAVEELNKLVQEAEEDVKTTEVFKGALEALEAATAATSS